MKKITTYFKQFINPALFTKVLITGTFLTLFLVSFPTFSWGHSSFVSSDPPLMNELDFKMYPNPTKGGAITLIISGNETDKLEISLYNTIGSEIYSQEFQMDEKNSKFTIDPRQENIANGLYFLAITEKDHRVMKKLVIN